MNYSQKEDMMVKNIEIADGKIIYTNKKESYIFFNIF